MVPFIEVFGMKVNIELKHPVLDDDGNKCDGTFDYKSLTISIDKQLSRQEQMHTLVHELGHALFHRVSLGQTEIDSQIEEIIVNNIATLMTEVFDLRFRRKK